MNSKYFYLIIITLFFGINIFANKQPLKIAVIGLTHAHVHWILGSKDNNNIEIVAIVESNKGLAERYSRMHDYSLDIVYETMKDMLEVIKPEAVAAFGTIYEHLEVVEKFALLEYILWLRNH